MHSGENMTNDSVTSRYRRILQGGDTERMAFFSDAVFAIAMTLLVIDLKIPDDHPGTAWDVIVTEFPSFLAYALSFVIIGLNWLGHHRKFKVIKRNDPGLMVINLALLFFVTFVPFPTSLLSTYGAEVPAVVLYAFVVGLLSVIQWIEWTYAWRKKLVDDSVDTNLYRYVGASLLMTPAVFWFSIILALAVSPEIAMYSWFLLIPVNIITGRIFTKKYAAVV